MTKHQAAHLPIELHLDKTYDVSNSFNVLAALDAEQIGITLGAKAFTIRGGKGSRCFI